MIRATLAHVQSYVGRPATSGVSYHRVVGELETWGWPDTIRGERGWWYGVTLADLVISVGWTLGGEDQRDEELRRAIAHHAPAQVSA